MDIFHWLSITAILAILLTRLILYSFIYKLLEYSSCLAYIGIRHIVKRITLETKEWAQINNSLASHKEHYYHHINWYKKSLQPHEFAFQCHEFCMPKRPDGQAFGVMDDSLFHFHYLIIKLYLLKVMI